VLDETGHLNPRFDGAQDHDLILRLAEKVSTGAILHVPEVLYHWRASENSTALNIAAKPYAVEAGEVCVQAHLERIGRPADVTNIQSSTLYHQRWQIGWEPSVDIIIPFKDQIAVTSRCVDAILEQTRYSNFTLTLIDNWSASDEATAFVARISRAKRVRVLRSEEDFNYSRLNNQAAAKSSADFLFLMNNDIFIENGDWLGVCVAEALADPAVGIVGGKLLYPNRTVQHAGIVSGLGGVAGHIGVGLVEEDFGYAGRLLFAQEVAAVTAAAMLIRSSVFRQVGGFDEEKLKVAFNDVDLCLKVRRAGYKIIWTPDFVAEHHESLSRGSDDHPLQEARFFHEAQTMVERWGATLMDDPFYNKNFTLDRSPFSEMRAPDDAADQARPFKPKPAPVVDPMQPSEHRLSKRRKVAKEVGLPRSDANKSALPIKAQLKPTNKRRPR
jgi:GT2 family glycosyltransferase